MIRMLPMLGLALASALGALGAQAQAQDETQAQPNPQNAPSGLTLTCELTSGPRAGTSFEFTGTVAMPARLGSDCSDMAGSLGRAVGRRVAGQPSHPASPREPQQRAQGQGRYYEFGQGDFTFVCRFTHGPHAGVSSDFSQTPGSNSIRVGSGCTDGHGSTGVAVLPSKGQVEEEEYGPY